MNRTALFKKWNKNPQHDYNISETLSIHDDTDRQPDICFVYSGRNRGKSFEVSANLIADSWYKKELFGYVRRYDATTFEVEQYFADKVKFIQDMTDGARDGITRDKGRLKFYKDEVNPDTGEVKRVMYENCGYFFALSRQTSFKSLQFPDCYNLIYEEVLSDSYLRAEPEKLMNLYSTINRSKDHFTMWLISNTISVVNPYSSAWGIQLSRIKPGEIKLTKLFLKSKTDGKEDYILISSHYLKNKDELTKEEEKEKKNRIRTAITSNSWEELRLFPHLPISFIKKIKPLYTVVFEYNDMMFQCDIIEVPENIFEIYRDSTEEEPIEESKQKMPSLYIRRKTTDPKPGTRLYTNNSERYGASVTMGYKIVYKLDRVVETLLKRGWVIGADNLTMNDFDISFSELSSEF